MCFITRLITSVNYAEDIDSLRFALATQFDYNILNQRPHFPGYPIFCYMAKIIYFFIGSIQYTFSIVGSISMIILIFFSKKIASILYFDKNYFLTFIFFINPFFWILSNRYMSDLFGLSFLIMACYYFLKSFEQKDIKYSYFASFILGTLVGIRASFLPFFLPFIIYFIISNTRHLLLYISFFSMGILLWLIPLLCITDPIQLYNLALTDVNGHFNNWGGTILSSDNSIINRFYKTFESIWADGLGGWWIGRNFLTLISSIGISIFIFNGLKVSKNKIKKKHSIILSCILVYFIWILFFQNVVYKPRHVIPLIPFLLMLIDIGFQKSIKNNFIKILSVIFCISIISITGMLNYQHKYKKTAINQMKETVINYEYTQKVFYSSKLIRDYINSHMNKYGYLEKYSNSEKNYFKVKTLYNKNFVILSTIKLDSNFFNLVDKKIFFHNPYMNRLWPTIHLYIYSKSVPLTK